LGDRSKGSQGGSTGVPAEALEGQDKMATYQHSDDIVRTTVAIPSKIKGTLNKSGKLQITPFTATSDYSLARSYQKEDADEGEDNDDNGQLDPDLVSPANKSIHLVPHMPGVIYGKAHIIDIQSVSPKRSDN
jgi:hypothetical protein